MRTLAALAFTALALAVAACQTNYDTGGYERPWDVQRRMERGHYG